MPSTTVLLLAAKMTLAVAAAASFAPQLVSVAGAVYPRACGVARFWLAPPYLFVTVHLIILVIWKLSDHKHFHHRDEEPWPVVDHAHLHQVTHPPAVAVQEEVVAPHDASNKAKEGFLGAGEHLEADSSSPDSTESCVTTEESDEDASSAPPTTFHHSSYSSVEARKRSVAAPVQEREPSPSRTKDDDDDDDLDATWNAIMQKTRPAPAQQSPRPRARDPSVGAEEMNRRFDDFIRKNRKAQILPAAVDEVAKVLEDILLVVVLWM